MAYNLRFSSIRNELLHEEELEDQSGSASEYAQEEDSSETSEEGDVDMEDASLNERLLYLQARGRPRAKLRGKNGFLWDTRCPSRSSDRQSTEMHVPGPKGDAANATAIEEFWSCLFNQEIIDIIVKNTNIKIKEECMRLVAEGKKESYHHHTDDVEIKAYIAVLYYTGLWKSSDVNDNRLWDKANGITFYRCVFSRQRFGFLSASLRFDNKATRNSDDRFSPIRQLWTTFIDNCKNNYNPSSQCTVDEQLLDFRGRCKFRVYMKDKPDKYGLKIISLNDAITCYMIYAIPYLGKNSAIVPVVEAIPEYYFRLVTEPIYNTNRSVTCDNWYTSIPLLTRMLKDPYNIQITGTIRKNKREIPAEFKVAPKERPCAKFCHADDLTLVSYAPKKKKSNKIVLVVSSFIHTTTITDEKPNLIRHYNVTKGGTDNFDKLCHSYTVSGRSNRWPMRSFCGMLDQSIVNARILLACKNKISNIDKQVTAIECLESLYQYLVKPYLHQRYNTISLRKDLRLAIAGILKIDVQSRKVQRLVFETQRRCEICTRKEDRKTKSGCASCHRAVCQMHSLPMCNNCADI